MTPHERAILFAAIEDYTGLWELRWELEADPSAPEKQLAQEAREALRSLLQEGFVSLFRGDRFAGEQTVVPPAEIESVLSVDSNWVEPEAGTRVHIRVGATAAGESAYASDDGS